MYFATIGFLFSILLLAAYLAIAGLFEPRTKRGKTLRLFGGLVFALTGIGIGAALALSGLQTITPFLIGAGIAFGVTSVFLFLWVRLSESGSE